MGPRNLLILFFSTVAVSLVILIIFFSLFFKNVDLNFNTRLPQSAPDIGTMYGSHTASMNPESKADGLLRSTVNVPPEIKEEPSHRKETEKASIERSDSDLPPMSDDGLLNNAPPHPLPDQGERENASHKNETQVSASNTNTHTSSPDRKAERPAERPRIPTPAPIEEATPLVPDPSNGPPVPSSN